MVSLANRRSNLILVALTLVVALATAAPARATPLYSITNLGPSNDPTLKNLPALDPTLSDPLTFSWSSSGQVTSYSTTQPQNSSWGFVSGAFSVGNAPLSPGTGNFTQVAGLQVGGEQQTIMPPGASFSIALGVSSTGDVVGYSNSKTMINFVYSYASKSFLNLNNLQPASPSPGPYYLFGGEASTSPFKYYGINAQNQVVGTYFYGNQGVYGLDHAFIASLTPGTFGYGGLDLNRLLPPNSGWILTSATAINDAGQIVGYVINPEGVYSGYELTPVSSQVPEPSVLAFFGLVGLGLAAQKVTRRNRK